MPVTLSPAVKKLGLSVAVSLGLWLMLEAAATTFFAAELQAYEAPPRSPQQGAPNMLGNPYLLWEIAPGVREEQGVTITINSRGLRGPEPVVPKPDGVRRFVTTGDSSVFGFGVEDDQVFSAVAADRLGDGVEAINAAIPGYSSFQSINLLRMRVLDLDPDLFVIGNIWSDNNFDSFVDKQLLTHYRAYEEGPIARLRRAFAASAVFRVLDWRLRVERTATEIQKVGWMLGRDYQVGERRVEIDDYAHNLQTLVDMARGAGAEVVFLMLANEEDVPAPQGGPGSAWDPYRDVMREAAARNGAPLLEIPPVFQASGKTDESLFLDQMHPTATGHRLMGEALADLLEEKGWPQGGSVMGKGAGGPVPDYVDPYVENAQPDPSGPAVSQSPEGASGGPPGAGSSGPQVAGTLRYGAYKKGALQIDALDGEDAGTEPRVLTSVRLNKPGSFSLATGHSRKVRLRVYLDLAGDGPTQDDKVFDLGTIDVDLDAGGVEGLVIDLDAGRLEQAG